MRPSQVTSSGTEAPSVQKVSYLDKIDDEDVLNALENLRRKKTLRKNINGGGGVSVGTPPRPPPPPPPPRPPSVSPPHSMHMQHLSQAAQEETSSTRSVTITHQVRTNKNKTKNKNYTSNNIKTTTTAANKKSMKKKNRKIWKTPSSSNDSHQTASTKSISSILSSDHEDDDDENENETEKEKMDVLFGIDGNNNNGSIQYYYQVDDDDDLVEENMAHAPQRRTDDDATGGAKKTQTGNNGGGSGGGGLWDRWENVGTSFLQRFSCQPVMTKMVSSCEPLDRNAKYASSPSSSSSSSSPSSTIIGPFRISQESKDRLVQQKEELVQNLKIRFDQMLVNSGTGGDGSVENDDVDTVLEDAAMAAATASALDDNATATSLYLAHKELREAIAEARRTRGPLTSEKRIEVLTLRLRVMSKKVMDKVDDFLFGMDDDDEEDDEETAAVREFLTEDDRTYLTSSVADQSFDDEEETLGTYLTTETKSKVPNGEQATTNDECITPPRRGGKGNTKSMTTSTGPPVEAATTGPHQPPQLVRKSSVTATAEIFDPSQAEVVEKGIRCRCDNDVPEDELFVDAHRKPSASFEEVSSLDGGR